MNKMKISTEISIGVSVMLCLLICHITGELGCHIQALSACTGAVMCVQDSRNASWGAGLNRILGVICGGATGIAVVLLDNLIQVELMFYLLMSIGVVLNLLLCRLVKLPFIQARVSCMSLILVALVLQGGDRINFAFDRFFGTIVGAGVALIVSVIFTAINNKNP